jgi:hypothetical protein
VGLSRERGCAFAFVFAVDFGRGITRTARTIVADIHAGAAVGVLMSTPGDRRRNQTGRDMLHYLEITEAIVCPTAANFGRPGATSTTHCSAIGSSAMCRRSWPMKSLPSCRSHSGETR